MNELQSSKNHLIRSRSSLYHVQLGEYYRGGDKMMLMVVADDDHNSNDVVVGITVTVIIFCFVFFQVKNKLRDLGKHGRFQIESVKDTSQEFKSTIQRSGR